MKSLKPIGILRFLGTNCDRDIWQAVVETGLTPDWLWYEDSFVPEDYEAFIVPGGFSYGDYLRCGALAAKAPVMQSLKKAADAGRPILGICNGFQILCDAGILPGALVQNESLQFVDKWVTLKTETANAYWGAKPGQYRMPVAHGEGRYYLSPNELQELNENGQIWLTYKDNPNGSIGNIAGVMNNSKNVAGLMPHPERAFFDWMGGSDGRIFFESLLGGAS